MNEAQTRLEFIDPALKRSGWNAVTDSYMRVEYTIAPGRIEVGRKQQRRAG
jgi:type I restriction enzyme R subunit